MRRYWFLMLISLALTGCARPYDRMGPQVGLHPVTFSLSVSATSPRAAMEQIEQFVDQYRELLLTQPVELRYTGNNGKKLALQVRSLLFRQGVEKSHLTLKPGELSQGEIRISVMQYLVDHQRCPYQKIEQSERPVDGCAISTNRWQSLVNPGRAAGADGQVGG